MKAAVMYTEGIMPQYTDIAEPIANGDDEILVSVKAVAIKHLDKARAAGTHYSAEKKAVEGKVIGGDGVCLLPNGTRVYAIGESGMLAEKAVISKSRMVKLPDGISDAAAAALPNAVIGSAMGLRFKADVKPGDVVLINGATGFTGKVAVQIAKHYGAGKVIATGRNIESLKQLKSIGADEAIAIEDGFVSFEEEIKALHQQTPIDVVIDYLWGTSAEIILGCLMGKGNFTHNTRYVSVGAITGDIIKLSAETLRSVNLQLSGSGLGAWTKEQVGLLFSEILPEMFKLAAAGKLTTDSVEVNLKDIASLWGMDVPGGKRLVVII